ncbi:MAG TPA: hypothetical protein PK067_09330 [Kaistella chaponensis]|jgi:hypothetical protein|uniref:DUF6759 domain-containing protein n=1 Tax=Kaistella chaponensis TaxID=713588 RepID=UPI002BD9170B|nr:DUF6759 domain-containing protein [Kaistella chaponensis]HPW87512.1 hypothetical protein [Kaistella chaponensis]HQC07211.1 hypothetical protein [Kaistella chaponensis]
MYKYLFIFGLFFSSLACAQSTYTAEQVEKSTDPQVIANFIKFNPTHPRTPEFKRKLLAVINNDKSPAQKAAVAKPTVKAINTEKLEKAVNRGNAKGEPSEKNKRTAELLTHIFSNDVSGTTAYVQIINKSKCNLIVKISGKKFYNLDVPARNQNFVLVDKGNYILTTSVCDAKYSSSKNINKDIVVTLNPPK